MKIREYSYFILLLELLSLDFPERLDGDLEEPFFFFFFFLPSFDFGLPESLNYKR